MNNSIRISAPARLHVNLFDMSNGGYRQNGGIGLCINKLDTVMEFKPKQDFQIIDSRDIGYTEDEKKALIDFFHRLYIAHGFSQKFSINFLSGPPPHSGFGTGTATKLACSEAASIINNSMLDQAQLISASGRGGTSGVGINTYFRGGLSIDFGVKATGVPLGPSSARQTPQARPVQLFHVGLPEDWQFGVIISPGEHTISGQEEIDFFNKTCPIDLPSVQESIYHAISGTACAAIEADYQTFCSSINAAQQSKWKKAEWMAQSNSILTLKNQIMDAGAGCVGLSSLGPAVYFMSSDLKGLIDTLNFPRNTTVTQCSPNNIGRAIEID
ncbi:beta-ribofuranosylaminobenzene 5'-phosphate synthase family protein [Pseudomonas protegens]|uniref:beta-ribofuranosylaminobenzene 5'-phosphate synthase family protein n=1 Tax=Pseudomonas protegens TaxID=380021 RepID=UPI0024141EAA|nr:beta-ribofuranosylaminobenzene 5'-phosphate synthase family protein [Pseudomonas protegens]